jgi:hypothetical protein
MDNEDTEESRVEGGQCYETGIAVQETKDSTTSNLLMEEKWYQYRNLSRAIATAR